MEIKHIQAIAKVHNYDDDCLAKQLKQIILNVEDKHN